MSLKYFYCIAHKNIEGRSQQCIKLHGCTISDTISNRKKQTTLSPVVPHKVIYIIDHFGGPI